MNGSTENFDGLCGIIPEFSSSKNQIRCHYELGHHGPCSFEKYRDKFYFTLGIREGDYERWLLNKEDDDGIKRGFIESVLRDQKEVNYTPIAQW